MTPNTTINSEYFRKRDYLKTINTSSPASKLVQAIYNQKTEDYQANLQYLVNAKTMELSNALTELKLQTIELTESISYAKRIQKAIIRNPASIKEVLPESFLSINQKTSLVVIFTWWKRKKISSSSP